MREIPRSSNSGEDTTPALNAVVGPDFVPKNEKSDTPIPIYVIPLVGKLRHSYNVVTLSLCIILALCGAMLYGKKKQRRKERGKYVEHIKKERFQRVKRILPAKKISSEASPGTTTAKGKRVRIVRPAKIPNRNTGGNSSWSPPGKVNDRFRCIIDYTPQQSDELFVSCGDIFQALEFHEDNW
jgi:hypothetical protein